MNALSEVPEWVQAVDLDVGDRLSVDGARASVTELHQFTEGEREFVKFVEIELRYDAGSRVEWLVAGPEEEFVRLHNEYGREVAA